MAMISVTLNAREGKGNPDIKYVRKVKAKSIADATLKTTEELQKAIPDCEIIDIEARMVSE